MTRTGTRPCPYSEGRASAAWRLVLCSRQYLADERKVCPETIAFAPISGAVDRRGLPAAGVDVDAIPLPALRQRIATGFMICSLVQVSIDRKRDILFEVEAYRRQFRILGG